MRRKTIQLSVKIMLTDNDNAPVTPHHATQTVAIQIIMCSSNEQWNEEDKLMAIEICPASETTVETCLQRPSVIGDPLAWVDNL